MKTRFDISPNQAYWLVVVLLLAATTVFVANVQSRRSAWKPSKKEIVVASGEEVKVVTIVDADEVTVKQENGTTFVVRILGIKGFDPSSNEPQMSGFGQASLDGLKRMAEGRMVKIQFQKFKQDRVGRVLAYIAIGDKDIGLELVRQGHVVVYTRYPFDRMDAYLGVEAEAQSRRAGLWANEKATARVMGWKGSWEAQRQDG